LELESPSREREREREIMQHTCMWSTKFFQICTNSFLSQQTLFWQNLDYQIEIAKKNGKFYLYQIEIAKKNGKLCLYQIEIAKKNGKFPLSIKLKLQKRMESSLSLSN
jgi:hypothetical protein